ncbi:sodium-independent sulfate anion transporter isoform X4 [Pteropus medius]|uniref:sodium-independent sulfate anion transporter isoform X4 n=1 Tax=Pteropus vampyrus TaxID=132908 RepID=UPI00196B429F|nr:sodium-independent sulfate anion transporter isoform X4 [Pteropus giganteus]
MAPMSCCCSPAAVRRRLPVLAWLPRYSLKWLKMDLIAGLSVGLTVIPQALAYAEVAGLPPQYGLYSAFMGCFVYLILGTSRDVTLGPTAIMSLLVSSYTFHEPAYAVLLAFLSGCIQLAMGFLCLGFLLDFISCPVIKGFTSAAAITIGFGQVKNLLGLRDAPRQFFLQVCHILRNVGDTRVGDAGLGLVCMLLLLLLKLMRDHMAPMHSEMPLGVRLSHGLVWTATTASQNNYRIDANQELLAIGLTNVLGSFVSSYPVTGSFGRTAVNAQSGVCTPAGGLVTGVLVLLSLGCLTSLFPYIPKAALAAVIIMAVAPLCDPRIVRTLWRVKRLDLLPLCVTSLLCFWEVQYGILAGTLVSGLILLHSVARPQMKVSEGPVLVVQPASGLHFPAVETLREAIVSRALEAPRPRCAVLDCTHVCSADYTVVLGLAGLLEDFRSHGVTLAFVGLQVPVLRVLLSADLSHLQHFPTLEEAEKHLNREPGTQPYNVGDDSVPEHKVALLKV